MSELTDQQRLDAYEACENARNDIVNKDGLGFVIGALTGNPFKAGEAWLKMVYDEMTIAGMSSCSDILTPAQREIVAKQAKAELAAYKQDKMPKSIPPSTT